MNREDQIPIDTMNNSSDESADSPGQNQPISNIESLDRKISAKSSQEPILSIRPADVMCGRTKQSFNHVGNRRFRALTNSALDDYLNADSKWAKSMVASRLVAIIHSEGGRFLKQKRDSGEWYELSPQEAKSKVSHAIRDAISAKEKTKGNKSTSSVTSSKPASGKRKAAKDQAKKSAPHRAHPQMQAQIAEALSSGAQMPAAPAISSAQAQTSFRLQGQQYAVGPSYSSSIQDQIQQLRRQSDIGMTPPSQTPPSQPPMMMIPGRVGGVPTNPLSVHNVSQQHPAFLPQQLNQYPTAQGSRHLSTAPPPLGIHSSATTFAATNRHTMLQPLGSTGIQQSQQDQFQHQQQQQRPQQHYRASRQETKQGSNSDGGDHHEDDDFINFIDSVLGPAHHHPQPPPSSDKS